MNQIASVTSSLSTERPPSKVEILETKTIIRPDGYALPNYGAVSVTVLRNGIRANGFGEGIGHDAHKKALSEAIERSMLVEFREQTGSTENSNGWACHLTSALATNAAIFELIERHVALTSWQAGGPFFAVPEILWPEELCRWRWANGPRPEFFDLKILLSESMNKMCISALLFNDRGNFVSGHASGLNLGDVILSATAACFRTAHAALRLEHFTDVMSLHAGRSNCLYEPATHSLAYAYGASIPNEVSLVYASSAEIREKWQTHVDAFHRLSASDFSVMLFPVEGRVVARVKNQKFQNVFWGPNPSGSNFKKISPHCVG